MDQTMTDSLERESDLGLRPKVFATGSSEANKSSKSKEKKQMNSSSKNAIFIVIYPYKFTEFVWNLIELDEFKRFIDVQVWDTSAITSPKYSESLVTPRCSRDEVVICASMYDFVRRLLALRRQAAHANICILNEMSMSWNSISEVLCNILLIILIKKKSVKVLGLYNGGVPLVYSDEGEKNLTASKTAGIFSKISQLFFQINSLTTSPSKNRQQSWRSVRYPITLAKSALNIVRRYLLLKLPKRMPSSLTHRLVAGEQWLSLAMEDQRDGICNVFGHSPDFSNYLLAKKTSISHESSNNKTAVFLSSANPMFSSDELLHGGDQRFTSEVWYPTLTRFFDFLEPSTGVRVDVAGHYKAAFPAIAPCFGNRSVYYGKTRDMVRQSDFVITMTSTAISYAVLFKKPVIFIYSNQLKDGYKHMRDINGMAEMLGTKPINIDDFSEDFHPYLKVDEAKYASYEREVLTSEPLGRPNYQIILEDIMGISKKSA